jgi:carbamoyl-phosphate synthase/aspartate carbamoyltransferase/dihydroorotase
MLVQVPQHSKCGWSPFAGHKVTGAVSRVVLNGELAFLDGKVLADPGTGKECQLSRKLPPFTVTAPSSKSSALPPAKALDRRPKALTVDRTRSPSPESRQPPTPSIPGTSTSPKIPSSPAKRPVYGDKVSSARTQERSSSAWKASPMLTSEVPSIMHAPSGLSDLRGHSVLSVQQFNRAFLHQLFNLAHDLRMFSQRGPLELLRGMVMGSIFYEPSTRTSCSFTAAMQRLGGTVISVTEIQNTSVVKGETLEDFVRVMEGYCDVVVLRHPEKGAVQRAAQSMRKPIINAGDGVGEHPTQVRPSDITRACTLVHTCLSRNMFRLLANLQRLFLLTFGIFAGIARHLYYQGRDRYSQRLDHFFVRRFEAWQNCAFGLFPTILCVWIVCTSLQQT